MSNSLARGSFAIAILTVGFGMIAYAAHIAYGGADTDVEAVSTLHPVIETGVSILPWLIWILLGIAVIGGVGWTIVHSGFSNTGSGRSFR